MDVVGKVLLPIIGVLFWILLGGHAIMPDWLLAVVVGLVGIILLGGWLVLAVITLHALLIAPLIEMWRKEAKRDA